MVEKYADDSSDNGKSPRDELNEFVTCRRWNFLFFAVTASLLVIALVMRIRIRSIFLFVPSAAILEGTDVAKCNKPLGFSQ